MKIGLVCAFEEEINSVIEYMGAVKIKTRAMLRFFEGKIYNVDVTAVMSGVCKVNAAIATQILIDRFRVTNIIFVGVAGAIDERLEIFDTVVSSETLYHDVEAAILTQHHPKMVNVFFPSDVNMTEGILRANSCDKTVLRGRIVTGECFITHDGRDQIIARFDPACVDMETAAAAHVCYVNGIPFAAIRSVSDTARESGVDNFDKYCRSAAQKSASVLARYIKSLL